MLSVATRVKITKYVFTNGKHSGVVFLSMFAVAVFVFVTSGIRMELYAPERPTPKYTTYIEGAFKCTRPNDVAERKEFTIKCEASE